MLPLLLSTPPRQVMMPSCNDICLSVMLTAGALESPTALPRPLRSSTSLDPPKLLMGKVQCSS